MTVTFLPIRIGHRVTNPDVEIAGVVWEFKSPTGSSERTTIEEQFKSAKRQARRLVIDLARCGLPDDVAMDQISRRFRGQKRFLEVTVVDKAGQLVHLHT
ncbi:MAG: hypothetical protein QM602_08490 [Microbacterium sp.]